ncbi:MAG: alpha/beta fold hydrolase [Deltaproteobacteria bacterium]|nr:alpha/beta fold hydrolase [Deltaproteobacteria bacterium]
MASEVHEIAAADGYRLRYRVWSTRAPAPAHARGPVRATLVISGGVMSHSAWLEPIAAPLAERGILVVGAERRGSGLNAEHRGDAPSARALIDDLVAIIGRERAGGMPLIVAGWCWGAIPAILAAAALGDAVQGLALLAPGMFPTPVVRDRAEAARALAPGKPLDVPSLPAPITEELFTEGPGLESFILQDELRLRQVSPRLLEIMSRMGIAAAAKLRAITAPKLLLLARDDRATDNERTRHALRGLAGLHSVEVTGEHGLMFDAPEAVAQALLAFLAEVGAGGAA